VTQTSPIAVICPGCGTEVAGALLTCPACHRLVHADELTRLASEGKSNKEIAFELGLSPKTVEVHRSRLMERLQVRDLSGLTRYAIRIGLIQP